MVAHRSHISRRAKQKEEATRLLKVYDIEGILQWAQRVRNPFTILSSMLFSRDRLLVWRTITALGQVAASRAEHQKETIHQLVRHNFWMMNDESGNIGWYAPETIGEILFCVPSLIPEVGPLLLSYIHEEPFERGTHWAIARVAQREPSLYNHSLNEIIPSLQNTDAFIRGYTLMALQSINPADIQKETKALLGDTSTFDWYDDNTGMIKQVTVGEIAEKIIT